MRNHSKELGFLILSIFTVGLQCVSTANAASSLFFDDFTGPTLNPMWTTNLPPAYCGSYSFGYTTPATYIGAPNYGFQTIGGYSVIRLTNTLGQLQRCGWGSASNFVAGDFRYDARYNTLIQSSTTSIDGFIEIWIIDATNSSRYDIISPFGGSYSAAPYFFVGSTIDGSFTQTPITYGSNTWYHLVLQCAPGQNLRASILNDDGTELVGQNLAHGAEAYGSGFRIALSQCIGGAGSSYPVDVAVDYVNLARGSLTSGSAPVITGQPTNQTVAVGGTVAFSVTATGTPPLHYQWRFDGTNIIGATNSTLTLADVQFSQAGNYQVTVSNAVGLTNSAVAVLGVNPPPPSCDPVPSGIVSWWPAEDNANDVTSTNNGTLEGGLGFAPGEVSQAFFFNTTNEDVKVPASQSLNVGTGNGFTLEAWISCSNVASLNPIFEWNLGDGHTQWGVHFYAGGGGTGSLYANIVDSGGGWHSLSSAQNIVAPAVFQHVALTYDKTTGTAIIYCNGAIVAQSTLGSYTPQTSYTLYLGRRPGPEAYYTFAGLIDEPSIYNRALSSNEIAAIYQAGSAGKCYTPTPPVITVQPTNQTVAVGGTVAFRVTATGTPPLYYQWRFDGTNIIGATNSTLTLANVQIRQAGNYQVTVSNAAGSTNSAVAVLVVNPPPPSCDPVPLGIVAWWQAENNAFDSVGGNNGALMNGTGFAPGEVGTAFNLNGVNNYVLVNSFNLNVGTASGLTFEGWINPNSTGIQMPLFEYERILGSTSGSDVGPLFYINLPGSGGLYVNIPDVNGTGHIFGSASGLINAGAWQHVALTYDKASGVAKICLNGTVVVQTNLGSFTPQTSYTNLLLGARTFFGSPTSPSDKFAGQMDELSLYNRALSISEIQAIYQTGSMGKCSTPTRPVIDTQPTNQTALIGGTAVFSVVASGTPPLAYQWSFNGTNILNATNAILTLANVQLNQSGNYSVRITNFFGSTNSATAVLTVNPLPPCEPPPSGIVGWWAADGTVLDSVANNNAILMNGTGFAPGKVGTAFNLNGINNFVLANPSASSNLDVGQGSGLTFEGWIDPTTTGTQMPLFEYERILGSRNGSDIGSLFYINLPPAGGNGAGSINANLEDINQNAHIFTTVGGLLTAGVWQHVALTYDKASGVAAIYLNGSTVFQGNVGSFTPQTSFTNFLIGGRTFFGSASSPSDKFSGQLDEISLYNRALSSNEIAAIYQVGSNGKCPLPPTIFSQPASQSVSPNNMGSFTVVAGGTPTLNYQWSFNGTNLLNATNATLTLANVQIGQAGNYQVTVSNAAGSTNSAVATLTVLAPLVITQQPQSETVPSFSSASFTVAASGPGPLSYQWRKNGTNLVDGSNVSGSATTNLILTSVRLSDAGNYDVLVSNPYATTNSAVAVLTVPETVLSLGSTNAMSGSTIVVPVWMNVLGVENAVLASVSYDPTKLALQTITGFDLTPVYTQTNNGYVGFAVVLNPGTTFPAGNYRLADLIFTALPVTNHVTVNLTFGDTPTGRQVVDNSFDSLPATYLGGTVLLSPAEYEADVYPRTNGDSQVNIFDWIEEGRMVAGLDVPTNSDEFARADCAPRNGPDGKLTVADWVQAGRYALGLDPLTLVPPTSSHTAAEAKPQGGPIPSRILTVASVSAQRGQTVNVPVLLVCATNENAVGMTIGYNTNLLQFVSATLSAEATSGRLNMNTNRLGEVGIALALSPGAAFTPGTNQVAVLQFTTSTSASGTASLTLDNTVVQLQVADNTANSLAAAYVNGAVALPNQPALGVAATGRNLQFNWPLATGTFQVQEADSPTGPWTTITLPLVTNGANVTATCAPTNHQQFFRLEGQ